jgi:hypothetical protein
MAENIFDTNYLPTISQDTTEGLPAATEAVAPTEIPVETPGLVEQPLEQVPTAPLQDDPPKKSKYKSYEEALNAATVAGQRFFPLASQPWIDPKVVPQDITKKYDGTDYGFMYGVDNDTFYGEKEGGFKTFGKGVGRLGVGVVAKVGEGVGFIGSLLNPENWDSNIISNASDNAFSDIFNQLDEKSKTEWLPTYQEADDRNKGFWSRAFTDGDFWMTDTVDGLAFLVSAWVPGLALSKLSLGARLARGVSGLRLGVGAAEAAVEGAGVAANYTKFANSAFTRLDKFNAWALATASESMFEAKEVKDRVMDSLSYDEFGRMRLKEDGSSYTDEEKLRISAAAAQNSFIMNAGLLAATNAVELKWLGQAFGKTPGVAGAVTGAATFGESMGIRSATSGIERFLNSKAGAFTSGIARGVGTEGFVEENAQLAIQRINEAYGTTGRMADLSNTSEVFNQYFKQTAAALRGDDPEAATSIGLGGILGGIGSAVGSLRQFNRDQAATSSAVEAYNAAQENWLKFGNIYKTKTVESTDAQGNKVQVEKIVFNERNEPILDENRIGAVTASFRAVNSALEESTKVDPGFKRDALRDTAFAQFVVAHINAGVEGTIEQKLDAIRKSDPEQIAKLGFVLDENIDQQINKYKGLTAAIIRQNKLMNSDIMFDGTQDDLARKNKMVNIAADQAAYKGILNDLLTETTAIKNDFMSSENSSLSDGIVDQLNEYQYRIKSQEEVIAAMEKKGFVTNLETVAREVLDGLKKNFDKLEKDNETTVKTLEKDDNGFYKYEKEERNQPGISENINKKIKLKGELQNHIKSIGIEWAKYADAKNGKKNFLESLSDDMLSVVDAQLKEQASRPKPPGAAPIIAKNLSVTYKKEDDTETTTDFTVGDIYNSTDTETGEVSKVEVMDVNPEDSSVTLKINNGDPIVVDAEEFAITLDKEGWVKEEVKKTRKKAIKKDLDEEGQEESEELEETTTVYSEEGRRPKFEVVGFNKTFGRQYLDEDDNVPNQENGTDRFFQFTSKHNVVNRNYGFLVVTADNDIFSIRDTEFNEDDIKVVVVKKLPQADGSVKYAYVDVNNELIPEGQETKDNIIYRSLADVKTWDVDRVKRDYTVNEEMTSDEDIQKAIDDQKAFQQSLVDRTKEGNVYLDVVNALPGIQRIEFTSAIGEDGKRQLSKSETEGRVIIENPDFTDLRSVSNPDVNIALRVSTGRGVIMAGVQPGRLVMQEYTMENGKKIYGDKIVRVFNRDLSDLEKDNLIKAFVRLSELYALKYGYNAVSNKKRKKAISTADADELKLIEDYLKHIINYSRPLKGKSSDKYFWIQSGLHRGDFVIKKFDKENILKNRAKLVKGVTHHVSNVALQNNDSFDTIKFVKDKAVRDKSYDSYQEYLLASREDGSTPPVYTSLPLYDSSIPQRTQVQLVWKDPSIAEPEVSEEEKVAKKKPIAKIKGSSELMDDKIDEFLDMSRNEIVINGVTVSYVVQQGGFVIKVQNKNYKPKLSKTFATQKEVLDSRSEILKNITQATGYIYGANRGLKQLAAQATQKAAEAKVAAQQPAPVTQVDVKKPIINVYWSGPESDTNTRQLSNLAPRTFTWNGADYGSVEHAYQSNKSGTFDQVTYDKYVAAGGYGTKIRGKAVKKGFDNLQLMRDLVVESFKQNPTDAALLLKYSDFTHTTKEVIDGAFLEGLRLAQKNAESGVAPVTPTTTEFVAQDGPFFSVEEAVTNAIPENGKLSATVSQMNVNTKEVVKLAEATIAIPSGNVNAAKALLTKALIAQLDVDSEEPPFRLDIGEMEATEDFAKLAKFMKEKLPMFAVKKMGHLIHGKGLGAFMRGAIHIYENAGIGTGFHEAFEAVWATFLTQDEKLELASEFKSREGTFYNKFTKDTKPYSEASMYDVREMLAEEFRNYILLDQSIGDKIANFFKNLWKGIQALFNLSTKDKTEMNSSINKLFKKIGTGGFKNAKFIKDSRLTGVAYKAIADLTQKDTSDILEGLNYYFFTELFRKGNNIDSILGKLDKKDSNALLSSLWNNATEQVMNNLTLVSPKTKSIVETYKDNFYQEFKKNLDRYGVIFSEIEQDENDVTDTLGIRDAITIDPRNMTSTNVMLLLASLPQTTVVKGKTVLVKNDLNQPRLVNTDKVHTTLLNELSNVVSIIDKDGKRKNTLNLMFQKLDKKYKQQDNNYRENYGWLRNLKLRLKYENNLGEVIPASSLSKEDLLLRVSFTKSFSNARFIPEKLIISDEGDIYNTNPLINVNEDRIRNEWANNLKIAVQNKQTDLVKIDSAGRMMINRKSDDYIDLMETAKNRSSYDLATALNALSSLGIEFNATLNELAQFEDSIREQTLQILDVMKSGEIEDIADLYGKNIVGGRIKTLITFETKFNSEDNILSYNNAEGQQQFSVGQPSLLSNMINILNTVNSQEELIQTAPWLGFIKDGEVIFNAYQTNSELLRKGGRLFDINGKRKNDTKISYHVISGLGITDVDGNNTAKLQFPERVANKIHFLLKNIVFSNINSDKSTEYGIGIPGKLMVSRKDIERMMQDDNRTIIDMYMNQLFDEMDAAEVQSLVPVDIQYYRDNVFNLGHFRDIIGPDLIAKFNKDVINGELEREDFVEANRQALEDKITTYINNKIEDTALFLKDLDIFIKPNSFKSNLYITDAIDNDSLDEMLGTKDTQTLHYNTAGYDSESKTRSGYTEDNIRTIAAILALNEEILLTEQHKLIYGHPALYKDLPKRANGATSTKDAFVEDSDVVEWMDDNMPRNDGKQRSSEVHQTIKNISFQDMDVVSAFYKDIAESTYQQMIASGIAKERAEKKIGARFNEQGQISEFILNKKKEFTGVIKAYMKLNEADAMAMGLPDVIRDILFMSGKFTAQREAQWDYEIAYETLVRSGSMRNAKGETIKKSDPRYKKATLPQIQSAQEIFDKGNPGYTFEMLKPQYFGYAQTNDVTHPVFLKHALQPKFYRHVEGNQFEKLYIAAQKENVDIIGFESGQKVGNVTTSNGSFVPVYKENGEVNVEITTKGYQLTADLPRQNLYSRFYGIQVEQSSKPKKFVVKGTQVTKQVMSNFYENGKPINETIGSLIKDYNDTLREMMKLGKEELLKEIGLERKSDTEYTTKDISRLVSLLRKEAENRDLPDNMINAINYIVNENDTQSLEYEFDTLINRDKIDNILNSIVDSRVISQKMSGKSSPQAASTLYESAPRDYVFIKDGVYKTLTKSEIKNLTPEEKASIRMQSSDLKFYHSKDGKIQAAEVYITWPYTEVTPEELGLKLVNGVYKMPEGGIKGLDNELLKAIAFRIPTQGMNSIESIIIKGFTPAANGDMIVVPSEIVGKAGSDFDIDKLNIYLGNYYVDLLGKDYSGQEFNDFMIRDMLSSGADQTYVTNVMSIITPEQFKQINESTYTDRGKMIKGAKTSLSDISASKETQEDLAFIKASLTRYNASVTGKKVLRYIQPNLGTKQSLQNRLINIMSELVLRPENYAQLVAPNTTDTLKDLAEEIKGWKVDAGTKELEDEKSPTYLRTFIGSNSIRERYLTAKRMVGIAALHSTFHVMSQVSGLKLNNKYSSKSIYYLNAKGEDTKTINIKLEHHGRDENGLYSIGHILDKAGDYISDLISQALSGFVDGAKDPFVFDLNFSLNTANTWFYLQHHGVPVEQVSYFFNQPVLDSLFKETSKNRSSFKVINGENLTRKEMFYKVIAPYYNKVIGGDLQAMLAGAEQNGKAAEDAISKLILAELNEVKDSVEKFDSASLKKAIKDGNNADPRLQIAILMDYVEYEAQARLMSNFMQAIGYDTNKTKTVQENMLQIGRWERAKQENFVNNPQDILDNTFLGEMKEQKEDIFNMFRNFFITLSPEIQEVFQPLYDKIDNPEFFMMKDDAINLINKYQNFIVGYLLHTTSYINADGKEETLNNMYKDLFTGANSFPAKLYKLKNSEDPNISDNLIIKELVPMMTDDASKTDNIMLFRNKMDTFQINNVIESYNNLRSYGEKTADQDLIKFADDLAKFSILQSGLQSSFIDYKKVLSTEIYSELVKTILDRFKLNPVISTNQVWKSFHQNNWYNRSIVAKAPAWIRIKNKELAISPNSSVSLNDFLIKYVRDPKISKEEFKKMKKNGSAGQAFQPILFEKTDQKDKKGKFIYVPIAKAGNGNRMLEIYADEQESILPGNVMQIETQSALTAAEGYVSAKDLMRQPGFIKAMGELKGEKTQNNGLKALAENALKTLKGVKKVEDTEEPDMSFGLTAEMFEDYSSKAEQIDDVIKKKEEESVKCNKKGK